MTKTSNKKFKVLLAYPNPPMLGVVPLNMPLLAACIKKAGFEVKFFDGSIYRTRQQTQDEIRAKLNMVKRTDVNKFIKYEKDDVLAGFEKMVEKYKPDLIAISLVDDTIPMGLALLDRVKQHHIKTVVGGVGVTFGYKRLLTYDTIDFACIGEGEGALVELCQRMSKGEDCTAIQNLYTKGKDGKIIKNKMRRLVDINTLPPPDFSIFKDFRFYRPFHGEVVRMAPIDTDRGCPYTCTYCAASKLREIFKKETGDNYLRFKNNDLVISEIKKLVKKYRLNFIWFSSETFFAKGIDEYREFARRYIKEIHLPFWCQTRLDTFTPEKTKLLAKMGCKAVSVGLEHGNEQFRARVLKKFITNERIMESIMLLKKYKISASINNIVGFPDETRELVWNTINLNRKIYPHLVPGSTINVFIFTPYTGTSLRQYCLERGYFTEQNYDNWMNFITNSVLDNMPSLSKGEIEGLARTMPLYIKMPKKYFNQIKIAEGEGPEAEAMFEKLGQLLKKEEGSKR